MTDQQARWIVQTLVPRILADEGRGFAMDTWVAHHRPGRVVLADGVPRRVPSGGIIACIAGWTSLLGPQGKTVEAVLGLTCAQARALFYGPHSWARAIGITWPDRYYREYRNARTPSAKAQVAARLLTRVARTRGRCLRVRRRTVGESRQ